MKNKEKTFDKEIEKVKKEIQKIIREFANKYNYGGFYKKAEDVLDCGVSGVASHYSNKLKLKKTILKTWQKAKKIHEKEIKK